MTRFRTIVDQQPATPLGLLPARWTIHHECLTCGHRVATDDLLDHTQTHHHGGAID